MLVGICVLKRFSRFWMYLTGLLLLFMIMQSGLHAMSNGAGGRVEKLSTAVDSAAPVLTNPAGARAALAGTDHASSDQLNAANALVYIGLFDPLEHATPTPTLTPTPLPETILFEDWNTGSINPTRWKTSIQASAGGGRLDLENLGGGDYAVFLQGPPGGSGSDHTTWLYSLVNFPRERNLRVTFTAWCDPTDTYDWTNGQPIYAALHGPWHTDNTSLIYSNPEAMVRYWATRYFAQPGDAWPLGGTALPDFDTALENANSKAQAIQVRVWLGDTRGAKMEWANANGQWTTVTDNRGVGQGTGSPYLGWGTYATKLFVDDIHVERDGDVPAPTPTPSPTPTPTPTPPPVPGAETVLFEDWNTASINPVLWKTSIQASAGGGRLDLENLGGGDYAVFLQGPPGGSGSDHTTWLYSLVNFPRERNLRVTFTAWCDPTDTYDWTNGQPIYAALHGPWHTDNTSLIYSNPEAMVRYWATRYFAQPGDAWPLGGTALPDFDTALENANSKAQAIQVRVWLGDTRGAKMEWANANGQWTTMVDNRGTGNGTGSPYLGWGTYATQVFIDDIHVERDAEIETGVRNWILFP